MKLGILAEDEIQAIATDVDKELTGDALTAAIKTAYGQGGIDAALGVIRSGMTKEEVQAVCDGKGSIGDSDAGLVFVNDELQPKTAKAEHGHKAEKSGE